MDAYPGTSCTWSIDVWITDREETAGFASVERLRRLLRPEHSDAILRLKREYHRHGKLRDGLSRLIHEAVVDEGIRSVEEFDRFLRRKEGRAAAGL